MKAWQIILTGFIPYLMSYFSVFTVAHFKYGIGWNEEAILFNWPALFYLMIPYCLMILPWYYVQYIMLHHFNKRAFYVATLAICILQPIIISIFLKVRIGSPEFFVVVSPILIIGIVTAMVCIRLFYKPDDKKRLSF